MTTHLGKVKAITNAIIWVPRVPQEHSVRLWTKRPSDLCNFSELRKAWIKGTHRVLFHRAAEGKKLKRFFFTNCNFSKTQCKGPRLFFWIILALLCFRFMFHVLNVRKPIIKRKFSSTLLFLVLDFWALLSGNSKSCKTVSKQELKLCNLIWNLIFNSFLSRWPFVQQISKRNSGGGEQCHLMCGYRFVLSHINFNFDVIIIRSERKTLKMKFFAFRNLFNVNKKLNLI